MRRAVTSILLSALVTVVAAQEADRTVRVDSIVVTAPRSLREIGTQKSLFGDEVLHSIVSQSLAEVLAQNSTIFIKSSGRASLSTASLRGTAPSHTQVLWNGLPLSNPMLGMTDFSLVPSYFVDRSEIYYGASSVGVTGGGLGGAIALSNVRSEQRGFGAEYVQNIASYNTFDEYLHLRYGGKRLGWSTRVLCTSSDNDFEYVNYDKLGHPTERNRSCGWRDRHAMQEICYTTTNDSRIAFVGWLTDSSRGIPKLSVDYRGDDRTLAWQDETALRGVLSWGRSFGGLRLDVRGGYAATSLRYTYRFSNGGNTMVMGVDSRNRTTTTFATADAQWNIGNSLLLQLTANANRNSVESRDEASLNENGYSAGRAEYSIFGSVRWKPVERVGVALNLREEWIGGVSTPLIPALCLEYALLPHEGLTLSASAARNYRAPTLNDLYYVPGGNPDLRPEEGYTVDGGLEFGIKRSKTDFGGKLTAFASRTDDWILWQPTAKGFWTPMNLAAVEARGVESNLHLTARLGRGWQLRINALYGMTRSENRTEGDAAYGKQLPYIPIHSAALTAAVEWHGWNFTYRWQFHSERYTSYAGGSLTAGTLPDYYMNDISLSRKINFRFADLKVRVYVNNLLDEEYQSILARPMPRRNYALAVEFAFGQNRK